MIERKLKLIKSGKKRAKQTPKADEKQLRISNPCPERSRRVQSPIPALSKVEGPNLHHPVLTPAEQAEAERFKALTKERAARQAKVRLIIRKLQEWDVLSRVA